MSDGKLLETQFRRVPDSLFHTPAFFRLHAGEGGCLFEYEVDGAILASVHFTPVGEGRWRSPARGTYAGYWADPALGIEQLAAFHAAVEARLAELGARSIEILPAPEAYGVPAFANQLHVLLSSGFAVGQCDLTHALRIDGPPIAERMNYGNRKRLRKCEREGLRPEALPIEALPAVYSTIAANREAKGYSLSMTIDQLEELEAACPGVIRLFGIAVGDELAAAALCLRLRSDVLYIFYWGDRPGYSAQSPVVALAAAIFDHCRAEGIALLDAGTSTIGADLNPGLIHFKQGLGFEPSLKLRLTRTLD